VENYAELKETSQYRTPAPVRRMKLLTEENLLGKIEYGSGDYTRDRKKSFEKKSVKQIEKEISERDQST